MNGAPDLRTRMLSNMKDNQIDYSIHISPRYRYMYLENPKVGCTSIKEVLQDKEILGTELTRPADVHNRKASPLSSPRDFSNTEFEALLRDPAFLKFSFVRNPFVRTLSCYIDKIENNQIHKRDILQTLGKPEVNLETFVSYAEFLSAVARQDVSQMDIHWRPQTQQIFYHLIDYNFIGRMEDFNHDWQTAERLLFPETIAAKGTAHKNKSGAAALLDKYYSGEEIELVRKIYAEDFSVFNYDSTRLP